MVLSHSAPAHCARAAVDAYQEIIALGKAKQGSRSESKDGGKEPDAGDDEEGIPHEVRPARRVQLASWSHRR